MLKKTADLEAFSEMGFILSVYPVPRQLRPQRAESQPGLIFISKPFSKMVFISFLGTFVHWNLTSTNLTSTNVLRQKVPYFNVSRQNRVVFNCFATKHAKDVRSGQPLFCNQPPRGPESEPEIARVTQRESEWARES